MEQIPTTPHLAAHILIAASGDIRNKIVGDFGCGTGMLAIGCSFIGSAHVIAVDIDNEALETAWVNLAKLSVKDVYILQSDIRHFSFSRGT